MPRVWAQAVKCDGTRYKMMTETMKTKMRCRMHVTKTMIAVRRDGCVVGLKGGARGVVLGKKRRKRSNLTVSNVSFARYQIFKS